MFIFGAGNLYGIPLQDASGTAITNPTPVKFGTLQEVSLDLSYDMKQLYGQNQFPVAVGRAKGKVSGKAKLADINGALLAGIYFGQSLATGLVAVKIDTTGAAIPATPFKITPTPPDSGTWSRDLGVRDSTGVVYTCVASATNTGEYSVSAGEYTFVTGDSGKTVYIDFVYTKSGAAAGHKLDVMNMAMGYMPTFRVEIFTPYQGKTMLVEIPNAVSTKLSFATKLDDFSIPEFDFEGFADASGKVITLAFNS